MQQVITGADQEGRDIEWINCLGYYEENGALGHGQRAAWKDVWALEEAYNTLGTRCAQHVRTPDICPYNRILKAIVTTFIDAHFRDEYFCERGRPPIVRLQ